MAMNIKDPQTEALAAEVAALANETKTQAVRTALQERKERLQARQRRRRRADRIDRFLEGEAWRRFPTPSSAGRSPRPSVRRSSAWVRGACDRRQLGGHRGPAQRTGLRAPPGRLGSIRAGQYRGANRRRELLGVVLPAGTRRQDPARAVPGGGRD